MLVIIRILKASRMQWNSNATALMNEYPCAKRMQTSNIE